MAIAHVQRVHNADASSASSIATASTDFTGSNFIDVGVQWQGGVTISSIVDTAGNTYTQFGTTATFGSNNTAHYRAFNITGTTGQTHTVTFSGPAVYRVVVVHGFSGMLTTSPNDENKTASGSSTAISSGAFTLAVSEEVIVALFEADADSITNATYNVTNFNATGDATKYFGDGYHIVTAGESATATCASGGWYVNAVSYKGAGGGAAVTLPQLMRGLPRSMARGFNKRN